MQAFQGKVVLITGGSSGIGRATALRLAGLGAKIVVAARNAAALDDVVRESLARGSEALAVPTDVTDREQVNRMVETAVGHFGKLDVLLCCAGISMRAAFAESSLDAMELVLRVNLLGTLYATHFALPHVKKTRGSLVAITSLTGKTGTPYYAMYGATKFAVQGLYESLRRELAQDGVHVGVVAPGFVDTPLRENVLGPDGRPWETPPPPPFRVWPVETCVDRILKLIERRRGEALLPAFVRPLLAIDELFGKRPGDGFLAKKFRKSNQKKDEGS
jgi:NAD(P)-dependent dehydrogenase (short-subunit alcohol dehydrogenase family)